MYLLNDSIMGGAPTVMIPASHFFCPYEILTLMLLGAFCLGAFIGMGNAIGWREFIWKLKMLIWKTLNQMKI